MFTGARRWILSRVRLMAEQNGAESEEDRIMAITKIVSNAWSKTAARVHMHHRVVAYNPNGIARQRYGLSKQLQDLHVDAVLLSETHLKPNEGLFYSKLSHLSDRQLPGQKRWNRSVSCTWLSKWLHNEILWATSRDYTKSRKCKWSRHLRRWSPTQKI
jgi:hypothetical protein